MIQRLVISLIHIITNTFFRRIDVVGIENVPAEGPVIFAGNHPNALMDGWLLTSRCGRWPIHFMANAKLWKYRLLGPILDATGAVPIYRREEYEGEVDNETAFQMLYDVIEAGSCMGVFPEGVSHTESQLTKLKTGTARIALSVAARGKVRVTIIPCGLNYIHRHRFRSQVLLEFGQPIIVGDDWAAQYDRDNHGTVRKLTDHLAESLRNVTLNAPDWRTLRFVQAARRLYKPATAELTPGVYVELSRRFVDGYLKAADDPEMAQFRDDVEDYQSRLEMLGLKDHQLRKPVSPGKALSRLVTRALTMLILLPIAIPGALLHLPVGWIAAVIGERFSYEMDDVATLKVFATISILPLLYLVIAVVIGNYFGIWWAIVSIIGLTISFFTSVRLLEAEASLFVSIVSILRLTRLRTELEDMRKTRVRLVTTVRTLADRLTDPSMQRIFSNQDFAHTDDGE